VFCFISGFVIVFGLVFIMCVALAYLLILPLFGFTSRDILTYVLYNLWYVLNAHLFSFSMLSTGLSHLLFQRISD